MPQRPIIPLLVSLVLHGSLLLISTQPPTPPPPRPLQATLHTPPQETPEPPTPAVPDPPPADTLLKNTLETPPAEAEAATPPAANKATAGKRPQREMEAARRLLARHIYYPEQAVRLGLEGTVALHVELDPSGRVEDVRVATSSGHAILDNAAIRGFYAAGRLPGRSGLWYYTFQLE